MEPISRPHEIEMVDLSIAGSSRERALAIADSVPPLASPARIGEEIQISKKIDWKSVSLRALSFLAGVALGVLTGLALAGIMATPVGWAIAGAVLLVAIIGSIAYGGPKEFGKAMVSALAGFGISLTLTAGAAFLGFGHMADLLGALMGGR